MSMKNKVIFPILYVWIVSIVFSFHSLGPARAAPSVGATTLVLYDAASGTPPEAPQMSFTDFPPGAAAPSYGDGATTLDTSAAGTETYAGWVSNGAATPGFPSLDRAAGFQLDFTLQVESESHGNNNRAGFSVIVLSQDARGIELAFWQDEIWAQNDDNSRDLFTHGEGVPFATTTGPVQYQLTMLNDTYTLAANTQPILSGPVRDYRAFDDFPDPYETPDFLFLGDNTTRAQARVRLSFVSITGTQQVTPTATMQAPTLASTSLPSPTAPPVPVVTETPAPLPTPEERAVELCPSGWIFFAVFITTLMAVKKSGRAHDPP
jgi:hypothetical protein